MNGNTQSDRSEYDTRWTIASFEKTVNFSTEAGKAIIYINGGAAVAMLTFCGSYMGKINFWALFSLGAFGCGALCGVTSLFLAYRAQHHYTHSEEPQGNIYNNFAMGVGILAGFLFLIGLFSGARAIVVFNELCQK